MSRKLKYRIAIVIMPIFGLFLSIICSNRVFADNVTDYGNPQIQKALLTAMYNCYTGGKLETTAGLYSDFNKVDYQRNEALGKIINNSENVYLPTGQTDIKNDVISCRQLLLGKDSFWGTMADPLFAGLLKLSGHYNDNADTLLKGLGYTKTTVVATGGGEINDRKCMSFSYDWKTYESGLFTGFKWVLKNTTTWTSQNVCADVEGGRITNFVIEPNDCSGSGDWTRCLFFRFRQTDDGKISITTQDADYSHLGLTAKSGLPVTTSYGIGSSWSDFSRELGNLVGSSAQSVKSGASFISSNPNYYEIDNLHAQGADDAETVSNDTQYSMQSGRSQEETYRLAGDAAVRYLSNGAISGGEGLKFDPNDQLNFYLYMLTRHFFEGVPTSDYWVCEIDGNNFSQARFDYDIPISAAGAKGQNCKIDGDMASNTSTIEGISGDYFDSSGSTRMSLEQVIAAIRELLSEYDIDDSDSGININPGTIDPNVLDPTCASSGAAGSLGWIVCPILEWMSNAAEDIYNDYVKPSLQVQPTIFTGGGTGGTREAWETFRNFANVAFIIVLMVVIFSQLTGYGIDNYGIKKILPRLIVAAVLINLSFLICEICVDLSNIVGNGLQSLFDGLATSGNLRDYVEISGAQKQIGGGGALTAVVLLAGIFGIIGVIANPAILLTLLVSALGVLISILFLFVLLAGRKAAIVILTVIAPVAIILFMLPNTKKYFDKWLKLWGAMLLLYPICGLLVGGGNYVSRLLLEVGSGADGVFEAFTAMIIGVLPIFFIPSVLKGSFAAMGNIGAKVSGFGEKVRSGATSRMRSSELYKGAQERGLERKTRLRAGLNKEGKESVLGGIRNSLGIGRRGMARARAQYLKNQDARDREASLMGVGYAAAAIGLQKKAEKDETADYMTLINNETRNGENTDRLYQMFDEYMAAGNKAGAVAVARIAGRRKDTADDFLSKKITGVRVSRGEKGELVETMSNVSAGYNRKALSSVMKEISTGESSGMYRSSSPLGFEFAAQFNREYREDANGVPVDGAGEASYGAWRGATMTDDSGHTIRNINTDRSMSNYVTDSKELVGVKNSSLREMNKLMEDGAISEAEVGRLRRLANDTINNKDATGVWDTTKAENIYRMAGRLDEYRAMVDAGTGGGGAGGGVSTNQAPTNPAPITPPAGAAREGETFNARTGETGDSGLILGASDEEVRQAMRDFDESQRNNPNWPGNRGNRR